MITDPAVQFAGRISLLLIILSFLSLEGARANVFRFPKIADCRNIILESTNFFLKPLIALSNQLSPNRIPEELNWVSNHGLSPFVPSLSCIFTHGTHTGSSDSLVLINTNEKGEISGSVSEALASIYSDLPQLKCHELSDNEPEGNEAAEKWMSGLWAKKKAPTIHIVGNEAGWSLGAGGSQDFFLIAPKGGA